jgi:hypothetical protein
LSNSAKVALAGGDEVVDVEAALSEAVVSREESLRKQRAEKR